MGLNAEKLKEKESIDLLAGNKPIKGESFLAQSYAGHQFGHFTMLGDGRAALIGEHITPSGKRLDVQLKGSGITPYSRRGDGRATLGPMLREYIISEALYHLRIPTTRSLAVLTTGETVQRERLLPGAILTRVASSHLRVGTFEFAARYGEIKDLKLLADYTINRHFQKLKRQENPYLSLLKKVIKSQAALISKWQMVGFIHGVMNTDNMTIASETIDYGPCAFMDRYHPSTVFSSIDRQGRYAYENQPGIGAWNLTRFAETLLPLIDNHQEKAIMLAQQAIKEYGGRYQNYWLEGMRLKLGILNQEEQDEVLIQELLQLMQNYKADFTNTFVGLTVEQYKNLDRSGLFLSEEFKHWNAKWKTRLKRQEASWDLSQQTMKNNNPYIIPRNHLVEKALSSAVDHSDLTLFNNFFTVLSTPYNYEKMSKEYMKPAELSDLPYQTFCGT